MNTSIHIPDKLSHRLNEFLNSQPKKTSKNSLIIKAIEQYLDEQESSWGEEFLKWEDGEELEELPLDREEIWREEII
ncbi:MAG: hypothetical protein ACRC06_00865 [Waterburya sp.]